MCRTLSLWPMAFVVASGCGARIDLRQPPDFRFGEDACDHCKMIISEARFAAGFYDDTDTPRRFDDIGCLVDFARTSPVAPSTIWVHSYTGEAWIRGQDALFVISKDIHTAMGSGIVAVDARSEAERLASGGMGHIATLDELPAGTSDEQ